MINYVVSIIIPVYNVQDYIKKCLESVAAQTFKGAIECLIIDDCGQDESIDIAERFINKVNTPNIEWRIIYHKNNKGLSAARNTGIREAQGEWLYFLDSDDWISEDCIEKIYNSAIQQSDIEMAIGRFEPSDGSHMQNIELDTGVYESPLALYCSLKFYAMAWNKLLRKDFIDKNDLFFKEGIICEDLVWSFQVACYLRKIAIVNEVTLYYLIRKGSIAQTPDIEYIHKWRSNATFTIMDFLRDKQIKLNTDILNYVLWRLEKEVHFLQNTQNIRLQKKFYNRLKHSQRFMIREIWGTNLTNRNKWKLLHNLLPSMLGWKFLNFVTNKYPF